MQRQAQPEPSRQNRTDVDVEASDHSRFWAAERGEALYVIESRRAVWKW